MQLLFAVLVFLIIFLIAVGVYAFTGQEKQSEIIRGRLESIEKGGSFNKNALNLDLIRDELMSSIPAINKMLLRWSWPSRLQNFIGQAGMTLRPGTLVMICAVTGLVGYETVDIIYSNTTLALSAGIPAFFLPFIFVIFKRARRMSAFLRQFPEVIDLLSRSVKAGHSFTSGLELVATDLPDPVAGEFRITFDEQRFGLPLRDALLSLCERVPLIDVRLFVIALLVQKETGGNLVEILDNLSHVIRERFRIAGEVRVRTAQGRLTAALLMVLPVAMLAILRVIAGDYVVVLFTDPVGHLLLIGALIMQVFGAIVIWRIVQIKV
jgi:tight adherence protein B